MYAKLNNGQLQKYPYTLGMLRKDNHNVSFPKVMTDEIFAQFGVVRVTSTPRPEYDHTKEFNVTAEKVNGVWVETWVATDVSAEELAQRTENQANNVRSERNQKLSNSDWTQLADAQVNKTAWATYRQSLRDVPSQTGFPHEVTWPEKP
jgi:hypothetical protein